MIFGIMVLALFGEEIPARFMVVIHVHSLKFATQDALLEHIVFMGALVTWIPCAPFLYISERTRWPGSYLSSIFSVPLFLKCRRQNKKLLVKKAVGQNCYKNLY